MFSDLGTIDMDVGCHTDWECISYIYSIYVEHTNQGFFGFDSNRELHS